jgi:DNA-binding LytR/AlgR family response regulator
MNILLVEDELHNQRMLQGMILELRPTWKIVKTIDCVKEAAEWLGVNNPDLIFMDIQLTDGICFSIFEQVKVNSPVIFTTAYDNYAIRAFKVNSIDYLLKPIKEGELEKAILKFENLAKTSSTQSMPFDYDDIVSAIRQGDKKYRTRFLICGAAAYFKLEVKDIAYFYSKNKISFAVTFDQKEYVVDFTMETLEEELDPDQFFRANRNSIVHINAVQTIEDYFGGKLYVKLIPPFKQEVMVSRLKNAAFKNWIGR